MTGPPRPPGIAVSPRGALVVAEAEAGRVVAVDHGDAVTVLADGLTHPVDIAFDGQGRCHVTDDALGAVLRIDDGRITVVADGPGAPQGLAVLGDELFTVESTHRRLLAISRSTGESRVEAEDLPVAAPPGEALATPTRCWRAGRPDPPAPSPVSPPARTTRSSWR